jgi:membrane associated rhomboid family serine protease
VIPLRHTLPYRRAPVVNRALVGVNVAIFLVQLFLGRRAEILINTFGFIPARLLDPAAFHYSKFEVAVTLVSALFLHGGVMHLVGNMIYLWVFGGPVEDAMGHTRYLLFFLAAGVVGSLVHTLVFPRSPVPSVGASGSIAGILGAFLVLRPRARIVTLFPLVVYWAMAEVRAAFFLPVWFAMQFFNGALALAAAHRTQEVTGVAWWAHVGGFVFGVLAGGVWRIAARRRVTSSDSGGTAV